MRHLRLYMFWSLLLLCGVEAVAQSYVQKHKHGDWYAGLGVGMAHSLAENARQADLFTHPMPVAQVMLGHNFTPIFGFRLAGSLGLHSSRCSEAMEKSMSSVFGNGLYKFKTLRGMASGVVNMTNVFFGYDDNRGMSWNFLFGAGYMKTFGFDAKLEDWNAYPYYPVNTEGGNYVTGHLGMECAVKLSEPWDLNIELRANATDNDYNGVSNGNHLDFFLDMGLTLTYHYKNGKQGLRRFRAPKRQAFVDPVLKEQDEVRETVRIGETMQTQIPFYAGFYYLNTVTTQRLGRVARFLLAHPLVNLNIVGHPDVVVDEDAEYHAHLAQKRAETVREALMLKFHIDPTRLRTSYDEQPLQAFKEVREWVPAVTFVMEMGEE